MKMYFTVLAAIVTAYVLYVVFQYAQVYMVLSALATH
jgi:hypothetical protein